MTLQPLENMHQEVDHQLAITKDLDGTPKGRSFPDEPGQTLQGILKCKAFGFVIGAPGAIVSSCLDNIHGVYI